VALLYRPARFEPTAMETRPYALLPGYPSRNILHVGGQWAGHPVELLVCHLPSVSSPQAVRTKAATSLRRLADSLAAGDPESALIVMGDLNANPGSPVLRALTGNGRGGSAMLHNPFEVLFRRGYGSYLYRGRWNLYDAILTGGTLPGEVRARIFVRDGLIQPDGPYRGYPLRTFSGTRNIGGTSDHLPVVLTIEKP
jgi:endonuclease/exonuclease/phosphatase family metal-dependent hydrolase